MIRNRAFYSRLKAEGKLTGTITEALAKRAQRDANQPYQGVRIRVVRYPLTVLVNSNRCPVQQQYEDLKHKHPQKKNWCGVEETTRINDREMVIRTEDMNNSRRYHNGWYKYYGQTRSFCCVASNGSYLLWFIGNLHGKMKAPRGYLFGADSVGAYIVPRTASDPRFRYHFYANVCQRGIGELKAEVKRHVDGLKKIRREQRLADLRRRSRENLTHVVLEQGVYVTFADSRRAGNCEAGTARWCKDKELDIRGCVPLAFLKQFENDFRVKPVIQAAIDRAIDDLERGYCDTVYFHHDDRSLAERVCMASQLEEALC